MLKDKKTKITFHNGMRTIGGTIIEVIYEDSHIFFDFGSEYNPSAAVQPTDLQGLLDEKLVPYIEHIFDPSIELKGYHSSTESSYKNTAVFLSHLHLDHSKIINYLDPSIPLYALEGTRSLLNTLNINNDFLFPLMDTQAGNTRDIIGVKENETVEVGQIKIQMMPVDHDAYGACGLRIITPDTVIAYTGDIRWHGYRGEDTLKFCQVNEGCDVLIMEGVSVSFREIDDPVEPKDNLSELELLAQINEIIEENPDKQITFNYYIANVERIDHMIQSISRQVVLEAYSAYVLKEATGKEIAYYQLDDINYGLNPELKVTIETLLEDQGTYFWQIDGPGIELIEQLKAGGIYIHCNAAPMIESDPAYAPFIKRFADQSVAFTKLSSSGHAYPKDLLRIITLVQPKLLVPIHSFHPERLENEWGDRLLPEKGETI